MLIEPVCYPTMVSYRPLATNIKGAVCNTGTTRLPGSSVWCTQQAGLKGEQEVPCVDVGKLVRAHFSGVDFMSIDVEGMEAVALGQLNLSLAADGLPYPRVSVILIEWRRPDGERNLRVLEPLGYMSLRVCHPAGCHHKFHICTEPAAGDDATGDELFWHPGLLAVRAAAVPTALA